MYGNNRRPRAKQDWSQGATVKVGFLTLEVICRNEHAYHGYPHAYTLWNPAKGTFYAFTPHNGLTRCDSLEDALSL